jgi:CPA2 family monovalent cation:H+ antiporter-2
VIREFGWLQDLAVVLTMAGVVAVVFRRLKQPVIAGYIMLGMILGPHTTWPIRIGEPQSIAAFTALGTALIMFWLGMGFKVRKLQQVGGPALFSGMLQFLFMLWLGYEIGLLAGWSMGESIFLGALVSLSSWMVITRTLADLGKAKERFADLISGILLIETIPAIVILSLVSALATATTAGWGGSSATLYKFGIFLAAALVIGSVLVPRLLGYVAEFKSNETLLLTVLALCFGFSLFAAKLGCSLALGAFIIGALVGEARDLGRIERLIEPVRDLFGAVFFVAVGLMVDPKQLWGHWGMILFISLAVAVGKTATCAFGAFVGGRSMRTSLQAGLGVAQIGEFSFVIALLGLTLHIVSPLVWPIIVGTSLLTMLLMPPLLRGAEGFMNWFERVGPRPLINCLGLYTRWVGQLGSQGGDSMTTKLVRRWIGQMVINAVLIAVIFIAATCLDDPRPGWLKGLGMRDATFRAALWLLAVVLSLPLFIGTFQKLQVLGVLVAGTTVAQATPSEPTSTLRAVVAEVVPVIGMTALDLYVLILGSALLPPLDILVVQGVILALSSWLLWRSFFRVYSDARGALRETLITSSEAGEDGEAAPQAGFLRDAQLDVVTVAAGSQAERHLIRELALRTRTGATIVAIERTTALIVTPEAHHELETGDLVLVLGSRAQLDAARKFLDAPAPQNSNL